MDQLVLGINIQQPDLVNNQQSYQVPMDEVANIDPSYQ